MNILSDLMLPARVLSIGTVANPRASRREWVTEVPIKLRLEKVERRVIPDLTASADILVSEEPAAVAVPVEAVFTGPEPDGHYVFVRKADGWEQRNVELGLRNNVSVAVRSGLRAGEEIALARPQAAAPKN